MQCAAVEFARNVCDTPNANSTEFFKNLKPDDQVIKILFSFYFYLRLLLTCQSTMEKVWEWVAQCV